METNHTNPEGTMPRYFRTIEELEAIHAEAASMSAACPICSGQSMVRAQVKQATLREGVGGEPAKFLGFQAWCVPCQMAHPVESAQLTIA